jgi:hypothetical protein
MKIGLACQQSRTAESDSKMKNNFPFNGPLLTLASSRWRSQPCCFATFLSRSCVRIWFETGKTDFLFFDYGIRTHDGGVFTIKLAPLPHLLSIKIFSFARQLEC